LLQALAAGCQTRSLQVYLHDSTIQAFVDRAACGGERTKFTSDALLVADSNLGGTKADFWLRRSYNLKISLLPNGVVRHQLRIHFYGLNEHGALTWADMYKGWLRIYLPPSAKVLSVAGAKLDQGTDLGNLVLEGWHYIKLDSTADIDVTYDINGRSLGALNGKFTLVWDKQSGREADPVTVALELPQGWALRAASVGSAQTTHATVTSDLSVDREFSFRYTPTH
jgi:hypothetical protein